METLIKLVIASLQGRVKVLVVGTETTLHALEPRGKSGIGGLVEKLVEFSFEEEIENEETRDESKKEDKCLGRHGPSIPEMRKIVLSFECVSPWF